MIPHFSLYMYIHIYIYYTYIHKYFIINIYIYIYKIRLVIFRHVFLHTFLGKYYFARIFSEAIVFLVASPEYVVHALQRKL